MYPNAEESVLANSLKSEPLLTLFIFGSPPKPIIYIGYLTLFYQKEEKEKERCKE